MHKLNIWYFDLLFSTLDQKEPTERLSNFTEENVQSSDEIEASRGEKTFDGIEVYNQPKEGKKKK